MKMDRKVREISNASLEDCETVIVIKGCFAFLIILNGIVINFGLKMVKSLYVLTISILPAVSCSYEHLVIFQGEMA